jgi:hypothetical protein
VVSISDRPLHRAARKAIGISAECLRMIVFNPSGPGRRNLCRMPVLPGIRRRSPERSRGTLATDIWQQLRVVAAERGWADIAAAAGQHADGGSPVHALVLAADGVAEPGRLAIWCASAAPVTAETATGADRAWWAEKLLVTLPAAVPEEAAPALFAEARRRWADRPRGSCVIVTVLEPDDSGAEAAVRRTDRTLHRLLRDTTTDHLVWSPSAPVGPLAGRLTADAERLAGFLAAEPDQQLRDYQRRCLVAALDERIAETPAAAATALVPVLSPARLHARARSWLRRTGTELLAGVDVVEQGLNRATTAGKLDRDRIEARTTAAFEEWRQRAAQAFPDRWADLLDQLSAPDGPPAPPFPETLPKAVPPHAAPPPAEGSAALLDVAAPTLAGAAAVRALSAVTSKRNAQIGGVVAGAVTYMVRRSRREDALETAATAERIDGRRYIGDAAAGARHAVREALQQTVGPQVDALVASLAAERRPEVATDPGAGLLRTARRELAAHDFGTREDQTP